MLCVDVTQSTFMANQEVKFIYFPLLQFDTKVDHMHDFFLLKKKKRLSNMDEFAKRTNINNIEKL